MTQRRPFTPEHRAKLSAAAKARAAREGVPSCGGFRGHKHKAKAKERIAAGNKARWERYWDAKQEAENQWAASMGVEPENVRETQRRKRNPNPKPRTKVQIDPTQLQAAAATKAEAEAKALRERAENDAFWEQFQ